MKAVTLHIGIPVLAAAPISPMMVNNTPNISSAELAILSVFYSPSIIRRIICRHCVGSNGSHLLSRFASRWKRRSSSSRLMFTCTSSSLWTVGEGGNRLPQNKVPQVFFFSVYPLQLCALFSSLNSHNQSQSTLDEDFLVFIYFFM